MSVPTPSSLRILVLHGFMQNASQFRSRTGSLRRQLKNIYKDVDSKVTLPPTSFEFIQAPHQLTDRKTGELADSWSWWRSNDDYTVYTHVEESMRFLVDEMNAKGPYDILLGFSQGAATVALLSRLLCKDKCANKNLPDWAQEIKVPPFKAAILIGGFVPRDATLAPMFGGEENMITVPSFHVVGETDQMVFAHRQHELARCFAPIDLVKPVIATSDDPKAKNLFGVSSGEGKIILSHDGGHFVPATAAIAAEYRKFLRVHAPQNDK